MDDNTRLDCVDAALAACEDKLTQLQAENEKYEDALERIQSWAKAYPLDIFPKPDLKKAAKVLKDNGMTLDSISADAMRHVLDGIKDIVEQALKGDNDSTTSISEGC